LTNLRSCGFFGGDFGDTAEILGAICPRMGEPPKSQGFKNISYIYIYIIYISYTYT
jgi:hypothetical protein